MTALFAGFERRCIHEGKEGKEAVFFWRLAEEAETKMKRRREGGWIREIGQINRRTTGSREEREGIGRKES
jgi:hypothetical protein